MKTKETKTKKTKADLIKEVQRLPIAHHYKKDLMKLTEEQLKGIIKFKKSLKSKGRKK